jgi:hypothetical protein
MNWKRAVVTGLNRCCELVDEIAYRPAVIRLTLPLPRWWRCEFSHLSMRLDARWNLGLWDTGRERTLAPGGECDICHRRPAMHEVGGSMEDLGVEADGSYMEAHPLQTCGWCKLPYGEIGNDQQFAAGISDARARSISLRRWRWHPGSE